MVMVRVEGLEPPTTPPQTEGSGQAELHPYDGARKPTRTAHLLITSEMLYQMSYAGELHVSWAVLAALGATTIRIVIVLA